MQIENRNTQQLKQNLKVNDRERKSLGFHNSHRKTQKTEKKYRNSECIATHGQVTIRKGNFKILSITRFFALPQPVRKRTPEIVTQTQKLQY